MRSEASGKQIIKRLLIILGLVTFLPYFFSGIGAVYSGSILNKVIGNTSKNYYFHFKPGLLSRNLIEYIGNPLGYVDEDSEIQLLLSEMRSNKNIDIYLPEKQSPFTLEGITAKTFFPVNDDIMYDFRNAKPTSKRGNFILGSIRTYKNDPIVSTSFSDCSSIYSSTTLSNSKYYLLNSSLFTKKNIESFYDKTIPVTTEIKINGFNNAFYTENDGKLYIYIINSLPKPIPFYDLVYLKKDFENNLDDYISEYTHSLLTLSITTDTFNKSTLEDLLVFANKLEKIN